MIFENWTSDVSQHFLNMFVNEHQIICQPTNCPINQSPLIFFIAFVWYPENSRTNQLANISQTEDSKIRRLVNLPNCLTINLT